MTRFGQMTMAGMNDGAGGVAMVNGAATAAFSGGPAWHKLGGNFDGVDRSDVMACLQRAGMDHHVSSRAVFDDNARQIQGYRAITHGRTGETLSIQSPRFGVVQSESMAKVAQAVGLPVNGCLELKGGRVVVIQQECGEARVKNDGPLKQYMLHVNSHDGSHAYKVAGVMVRVVCENTLRHALDDADMMLSVRHTLNADARVKHAGEVMTKMREAFEKSVALANAMVDAPFGDKAMVALSEHLFPAMEDGTVSARAANARTDAVDRMVYGKGHEGIRGTAWAAYNGVAEYADHGRNGDRSLDDIAYSQLFGAGAQLKARAESFIRLQVSL